jgi:signal transduction histidine kinase
MHDLLKRQLQQHWGNPDDVPAPWRAFIAAVDAAYREADDDRALREHTMEVMLGELTERNRSLQREKAEQEKLIHKIEEAQQHLMQSEKLASIGQLAAGVAHEINNPIGFVLSNLRSLTRYFEKLLRVLEHLETHREFIAGRSDAEQSWLAALASLKAESDYDFLKDDIPALLTESLEGVERVRKIVLDLRNFSRADTEQTWELADLRAILDSTLNIVHNEIKYHSDVVKDYGDLPPVECVPSQLGQVFMNLLVNAAQAMPPGRRGTITIRCGQASNEAGDKVWVEIADDGAGIPAENLKKIFDPFFTTKPVGKGTGLGLSLSYGIVEKHGGRIQVSSRPGSGTTFRITLPLRQAQESGET